MINLLYIVIVPLLLLFSALPASAVTLRYALIIGNNVGVDEEGTEPFPRLMHAEREARRLRKQLIKVANFDESPSRTRMLLNATREEVAEAFHAMAAQRERDSRLIDDMESMFLLYYTGHGLSGRLLLSDGPMSAKALTRLFNRVGADFSVGVFDACYSGSLDTLLQSKGIRPTRGLNMAKEMPDHVLSAKGSIWYVSSGAGQPSYEDKQMGGVFTHFFIEALKQARSEGPGITLDGIWQYARKKTVAYTLQHNRRQVPEQFVSKLRSQAPIYFSFPNPKGAKLVLSKELHGRFGLSYADGHVVKFFEKTPGKPEEIVVYPGKAELFVFDETSTIKSSVVHIRAGETLVVHPVPETPPASGIGRHSDTLFAKGIGDDGKVTATMIRPGASLILGAGYGVSIASYKMLHPRHRIFIPFRLDVDRWFVGIEPVLGIDHREYSGLSYEARMMGGEVKGGSRITFKRFELSMGGGIFAGHLWQKFSDSNVYAAKGAEFHAKGEIGIMTARNQGYGRWLFEINGHFGPMYTPGAAEISSHSWHLSGGLALTAYYRGV
ncbi:MAG: caspase family protein [Deltaproteobacteria bacterium]|nr:caspase family protein [Deltaproteobacteria bacterium]